MESDSNQHEGRPRWPRRVYGVGAEPDPRFTLANERTFLAWLRTALALMAAGVAVAAVGPAPDTLRDALAFALLAVGIVGSGGAFGRWMATERALRTGRPLPAPRLAPVLGYVLVLAGLLAVFLLVLR